MANVLHTIIHYFKQLLFDGNMLINIFKMGKLSHREAKLLVKATQLLRAEQ